MSFLDFLINIGGGCCVREASDGTIWLDKVALFFIIQYLELS